MPCSYSLSVHLYLILWVLVDGTIWPDVETPVPHCVIYYLRNLLGLILRSRPRYFLEHSDLTRKITDILIRWTGTLVLLLSEEEVNHLVICR